MTLRWPRAWPAPPIDARYKACAEDFQVTEELSFVPSGCGEHLYLQVRKTRLTTPEVAARLADLHGLAVQDIGYAGMKDKHAVATQWFSVPVAGDPGADIDYRDGSGSLCVVATARHSHKLRRGQNSGNRFQIVLRVASLDGWSEAVARITNVGVPNYFGPQRFGWDNLEQARAWLPQRRRRRVSKFKQGLYLSVLRSFVFNEVLGARVREDCWSAVLSGDSMMSGVPTGPLWGRGRSPASGRAAEIERAALAGHQELLSGLEHAGLTQQRRPLVLKPTQFQCVETAPGVLQTDFTLPAGGYATSLLGEVFELVLPPIGQQGTAGG